MQPRLHKQKRTLIRYSSTECIPGHSFGRGFFRLMPRQDIAIDINYGELQTTDNLPGKAIYPFMLLETPAGLDGEHYAYGEILVPEGFERHYTDQTGLHIRIPYTPLYKELRLRLRIDGNRNDAFLSNRTDGGVWFTVALASYEGPLPVFLSAYRKVNAAGCYNLLLHEGYLALYSGEETDATIRPALAQNERLLLKASAGNLYQHPMTGVGLIDFLHGNFENTGLAARLQQEFESDKMVIHNAYMDSLTGELLLEITEKNG